MADDFDPGALMGRFYTLPTGMRVRLRLARTGDRIGIAALLERLGADHDELEATRLALSDPRREVVICATALVEGTERVVGIGAIEIGARTPSRLIIDPRAEGLEPLLGDALVGRARALARARGRAA